MSKEAADRVAAACEIDHGGAMTYDYLYGCVELGIISENDIQTIERDDWDIVTVDTYVCGDGAIIFGRDALDDSAEEWNRENA